MTYEEEKEQLVGEMLNYASDMISLKGLDPEYYVDRVVVEIRHAVRMLKQDESVVNDFRERQIDMEAFLKEVQEKAISRFLASEKI